MVQAFFSWGMNMTVKGTIQPLRTSLEYALFKNWIVLSDFCRGFMVSSLHIFYATVF